jgi:tRNA-splicing ligase RtcB (3'-phosphate/5'-hydroxy nucleic acid ligase)
MKPIQIDPYRWEIPQHGAMRVPARIFATAEMMKAIHEEETLKQLTNVAQLPGILKAAMAMPDIHWGYGFPIGGVAAFDVKEGVISPGGVGYDINCGVRLAVTHLTDAEVVPRLPDLVNALFSGHSVGRRVHRRHPPDRHRTQVRSEKREPMGRGKGIR